MRTLQTARKRWPIALVAILALLGSACEGADTRDAEDVVRDALAFTGTQPREFTYIDKTPDVTYKVTGFFEDDFRYQAALHIDGELVYEEVVNDDRLAVRVHDDRALELLRQPEEEEELEGDVGGIVGEVTGEGEGTDEGGTDEGGTDEGSTDEGSTDEGATDEGATDEGSTDADGDDGADVEAAAQDETTEADPPEGEGDGEGEETDPEEEVRELLLSGVWVEDQVGAPSLLPSADTPDIGEDPVYDALTVLRYTQRAMREGFSINRFDPESITYRPQEDPFEPPSEEEGEYDRYDYQRLFLPSKSQVSESGQQQPPSMSHLRKMAVYMNEDDHAIRIEERVDIARRLEDLEEKYDLVPPEGLSEEEQVFWALDEINEMRAQTGEDPIRFRALSVEFENLGDDSLRVRMPSDTTVASLLILRGRGSETGEPPEAPEEEPEGDGEVQDPEVAPPAEEEGTEGDSGS